MTSPTKVVFETATIADSIKKAEQIAPDKGSAFDKAAGIIMQVDPANQVVVLRATNLDVFYMEWVDALEYAGGAATWRIPSKFLGAFVSSLPIGSGKVVEFVQNGNRIEMKSGRTKCSLRLIDHSSYPFWNAFDEGDMAEIPDLGGKIALVEWAASRDQSNMGVRLTHDSIMATNRYKLARTSLNWNGTQQLDEESGITIPPATLSTVLKKMGDTKLRINNGQLLVMPDAHTQIITVMIGEDYPPVNRIMRRDYPDSLTFKKQQLIDMLSRTTKITSSRYPVVELIIGQQELATWMNEEERGFIGDVISIPGQADHLRTKLRYDPAALSEALNNCPSEEITFFYDSNPDKANRILTLFSDKSDYEVWLAPRGEPPKETSPNETD